MLANFNKLFYQLTNLCYLIIGRVLLVSDKGAIVHQVDDPANLFEPTSTHGGLCKRAAKEITLIPIQTIVR